MANYNKIILLGNLTRDPELRYTASGTAVANFGLATNRRYKQAEEWKEETCFIDVVVFGRQAESCSEYLSKGRPVLIDGRLNFRKWENDEGQTRSKHEIVASSVQFIPSSRGGADTPAAQEEGTGTESSEAPF